MEAFFRDAGIPLIVFVICMIYGIRIILVKNANVVLGKNKPILKNEEKYCVNAGFLLMGIGAASLVMALLITFVSQIAALVEVVIAVIVFAVLWKRMNDMYGPL